MDRSYLAEAARQPEIVEKILKSYDPIYDGEYTVGVTRAPGSDDEYAFLLLVEDEHPRKPYKVVIDNNAILVVVKGGFRQAVALKFG